MKIEYDAIKNLANLKKHGISFDRVVKLDFANSTISEDSRTDYGELRFASFAQLDKILHCLIWTLRGAAMRMISFRKANSRERKMYEIKKNA